MIMILFILIAFIAGLYFCMRNSPKQIMEGFTNTGNYRCPNMLLQKDSRFYLFNSNLAKVPGVNPIEFDNLEDYVEFLDWQKSQGIVCPVLYLQSSFDAQGNSIYKIRPNVIEPQGGLPPAAPAYLKNPNPTLLIDATRDDKPYNLNSYPAFDQTSQYVGSFTPLDKMNQQQENLLYSPDAMDPNWGGIEYTQKLVDEGVYKGNEVSIRV